MNASVKKLAESKWFVPCIIFIMLLLALSSLIEDRDKPDDLSLTTEKQLEEMCNAVEGVKNAKVMITYEAVEAATFFESSDKIRRIQGIAIVCEGGSTPDVQLKLHCMLKALFGVSSTQITVSERNATIMS